MTTCLLDTSVLIDTLNNRHGRREFLSHLSQQNVLLACCAVNVTEIRMGMRPGEEAKTENLLRNLKFYPINWEIAELAGDLFRQWRQKGHTLSFTDVTIAAVALSHRLSLLTDNRKDFPMPELKFLD
jgi:predicted nucleic acid-binding protein